MDKQTFSSYGWLVITVVVIALMITAASPFADRINEAVNELLDGFDTQASTALNGIVQ